MDTPLGTLTVHVPKLREGYYSPEGIIGKGRRVDAAVAAAVGELWVRGVSTRRVERVARELGRGPSGPFRGVASGRVAGRAGRRAPVASPVGTPVLLSVAGRDVRALPGRRGRVERGRGRRDRVRRRRQEAHGRVRRVRHRELRGLEVVPLVAARPRHGRGAAGRLRRPLRAAQGVAEEFQDAAWTLAADELASTDPRAARTFTTARDECLAYMAFPKDHWLRIRTNNVQERENREIKRHTSSVGAFPSRDALQRLIGAVLMEADEEWSTDRRI